jgi:hypothetical protein
MLSWSAKAFTLTVGLAAAILPKGSKPAVQGPVMVFFPSYLLVERQ